MDRWGYLDKWKEYERKRARLTPGWVEACILVAVVASLVGGRLLHCAIEVGPLETCIAAGMPRVLAMSMHSAALLLGIWAGPRIGLQFGWLCGALLFVIVSAALVWTGFPIGGIHG
jgi:hypothetical protein